MAFYRAAIGGGGGGQTETTLWTNSAPTSNFNTQDVPLSDDYTNYKSIRIYYRYSTTDSTETYIEYDKSIIDGWVTKGTTPPAFAPLGSIAFMYGGNQFVRPIRRGANGATNTFYVYIAYRMNTSGNTQSYGIPTKITGIN